MVGQVTRDVACERALASALWCIAVPPGAADPAARARCPDRAAPAEPVPPEHRPQCDALPRDRKAHSSDAVRQTDKLRSSGERTDCAASSASRETPATEPHLRSAASA